MPDLAHPLGDAAAESSAVLAAQTDPKARDRLVRAYQPWLRALVAGASPAYRRGASPEDLLGAANVGLLEALARWKVGKDFATYAWYRVRKSMQKDAAELSGQTERRAFRDHGGDAALVRYVVLQEPREDAGGNLVADPMHSHLGDMANVQPGAVAAAMYDACNQPQDAGEAIDAARVRAVVAATIAAMPARTRRVCAARWDEGLRRADIARRIGISESLVAQLLSQARDQIRAALAAKGMI